MNKEEIKKLTEALCGTLELVWGHKMLKNGSQFVT